jgi:hypothetical protein
MRVIMSILRQQVICLSVLLIASFVTNATNQIPTRSQITLGSLSKLSRLPLTFTPNQGQWSESLLFRANAGGAAIWLTPTGVTYQLTRRGISKTGQTATILDEFSAQDLLPKSHRGEILENLTITAHFEGCSPSVSLEGELPLPSTTNYFLGNDPSDWHLNIPNYRVVTYSGVYPGVDLRYYGSDDRAEYDFMVSPGADYRSIHISFKGIDSLSVSAEGDLLVHTRWGELIEQAPIIYQDQGANRVLVSGGFRLNSGNSFGFSLSPSYNPTLPVVIDPVLRFSTYLGGGDNDYANSVAVDGTGHVFVAGVTGSANFPTQNQYQPFQGVADVFVTKLDSTGGSLVYSTYIGGTHEYDEATGITIDGSGNAYLTGYTYSNNFPTVGPYQTYQGTAGKSDAFALKLNSSGNSLIYSTYLGGGNDDGARAIGLDGSGNVYIAGTTLSTNFPTVNAYQTDPGDSRDDAFVVKLNVAGNAPVYSTYIGGDSTDVGLGLAVDGLSNAYVVGFTSSPNFPTKTPIQTWQGLTDAFVVKIGTTGNTLSYATYLGGSSSDYAQAVAVDGSGNAFIAGFTRSSGFPTQNPFQTYQGASPKADGFAVKLNSAGTGLVYGTYLGGADNDIANSIAIDGFGNAYVAGYTLSNDFPTQDPVQTYQGAASKSDAFVIKLKPSGDSPVYATYLGGSGDDFADAICVDGSQSAYVAGFTLSTNFLTQGPFQSDQPVDDAFVVKIGAPQGCCIGTTGNIDCDPGDGVDISDLSALIDNLYISLAPLCCVEEANVDGQPGIDISDLSALIDYLYINFTPPAPCQ